MEEKKAADANIELWKMKKLIKNLNTAKGNGTSMISLILPPRDQICRAARMLADEFGTATNIKSRVNRQSVLSAIQSTQQRLKLYTRVPNNGLVLYCGTVISDDGKEKKVNISFEPFKPVNTSLYLCDNKFHTEALSELLESEQKFGFIIMDGNGALFGTLAGNTKETLLKFKVELPKKHGRGGQSALRFSRLCEIARHVYLVKVAEQASQIFISNDRVNVEGLVLGGSADFKVKLSQADVFDNRLKAKILKIVDVSYGEESGFNEAINLSAESLSNVKFIHEKQLIQKYFDSISKDNGKYCFGIDDTLKALELGAVETLILSENLEMRRITVRAIGSEQTKILYLNKGQSLSKSLLKEPDTGTDMESIDDVLLVEWLAENYQKFGTELEFVSNKSQEGSQFIRGFGGIGGILRYNVNFGVYEEPESDDEDNYCV